MQVEGLKAAASATIVNVQHAGRWSDKGFDLLWSPFGSGNAHLFCLGMTLRTVSTATNWYGTQGLDETPGGLSKGAMVLTTPA